MTPACTRSSTRALAVGLLPYRRAVVGSIFILVDPHHSLEHPLLLVPHQIAYYVTICASSAALLRSEVNSGIRGVCGNLQGNLLLMILVGVNSNSPGKVKYISDADMLIAAQ